MSTPLGKRLRQYREAKGLTLQQVADAVGCTKAYIWELEMREGQRPTAERLNAIAKTLGVTVLHLLGEPIGGKTHLLCNSRFEHYRACYGNIRVDLDKHEAIIPPKMAAALKVQDGDMVRVVDLD